MGSLVLWGIVSCVDSYFTPKRDYTTLPSIGQELAEGMRSERQGAYPIDSLHSKSKGWSRRPVDDVLSDAVSKFFIL